MTEYIPTQKGVDAVEEAITAIQSEVAPLVKSIEASIATTQNRYDKYMRVLSSIKDAQMAALVAIAMARAGGNKQGITDALHIVHQRSVKFF